MKTSEEIKKGLSICYSEDDGCLNCPYRLAGYTDEEGADCYEAIKRDALKLIQQLETQVPRWISVKEDLPKDDAHYLVWLSDACTVERAMYYGDGEWLTENLENLTRFVTHWMPLPEAPKEE